MQDDNGKAPPIIGSNRLTVLKPEMSSSPFKYDPLFQSGGRKILSLRILITLIRHEKKKNAVPETLLNSVYLAPRQRSHQGRTLESHGPPSFLFPLTSPPPHPHHHHHSTSLRLQSHLEEDLESPLSSSLETKQIEFRSFDWLWLRVSQKLGLQRGRRMGCVCGGGGDGGGVPLHGNEVARS